MSILEEKMPFPCQIANPLCTILYQQLLRAFLQILFKSQCTCQVPPKSRPNFINRSQFKPKPDSNSARPDFIENGRPNFENNEQNRPDFNPARPGFDSSQFKPRPDFNSARPDFIQNGRPNFENDNQSSRPDFNPGRPNFDTSTSTRKLFLKPKIGQSASQSDPVDLLFVPLNDNAGY